MPNFIVQLNNILSQLKTIPNPVLAQQQAIIKIQEAVLWLESMPS
jgi:hypothetical protein